jgi:hypothetical protein
VETEVLYRGDLTEVLGQVLYHDPAAAVLHWPLLLRLRGLCGPSCPMTISGLCRTVQLCPTGW